MRFIHELAAAFTWLHACRWRGESEVVVDVGQPNRMSCACVLQSLPIVGVRLVDYGSVEPPELWRRAIITMSACINNTPAAA